MYDNWAVEELEEVLASQEFYLRMSIKQGKARERWQEEIDKIKDVLRKKGKVQDGP